MSHKITQIFIYPIKSLGGIQMETALALTAGFEHDRRWMLVDDQNKFMTQRNIATMALFATTIKNDNITISYADDAISFATTEMTNETIITQVWDDNTKGNVVNDDVNQWFSDHLHQRVKLLKMKNETDRFHHNANKNIEIPVSFADGYPYLIVGNQSLDTLNEKLNNPIPMNRFRPNIVVTSDQAHEEDEWTYFDIGNARFQNMKPCGRCNVITIDQSTAITQNEPLRVLNQYRKSGNSVLFGTNVSCIHEGQVSVGEDIMHI